MNQWGISQRQLRALQGGTCLLLVVSLVAAVLTGSDSGPKTEVLGEIFERPTITTAAPDGDNGWYRTRPTSTIAGTDAAGLTSIAWSYSGASTNNGSRSFTAPYPTTGNTTSQPSTPGTSTLNAVVTTSTGDTGSPAPAVLKWDSDLPSQPQNARWYTAEGDLLASPEATGSSAVASWDAATDTVSGLRDYRVQLSETTDFNTPLADRFTPNATTREMSFTEADGLQQGHSYFFRVGARDQAGNIAWSAISNRLQYTTELTGPAIVHAPVTTGYVGQEIPISMQATCGTGHACSGRLLYRVTSLDDEAMPLFEGGWTRVDLVRGAATSVNGRDAVTWSGTIPGTSVSTAGVDYLVEAEDDFALSQFPGATYVDTATYGGIQPVAHAYLHVRVVSPPLLVHEPPAYAANGQAIDLTMQGTCSTGACVATLHYRTTTDGAIDQPLLEVPAWPQVEMSSDPSPVDVGSAGKIHTYRGRIPAAAVDTRGVDYFFSMTDGPTTSWWPGTSAQGYYVPTDGMRTGYHHVHVLETPHAVHEPVAASPYRQPINVDAQANCVNALCTAALYYRTTTSRVLSADAVFASTPMTVTPLGGQNGVNAIALHGVIPPTVADTRGVDYFFSVNDGPTTTWWPGTSSVDGYQPVPGTRVGYHHTRILEPPHFYDVPPATAPALQNLTIEAPMTCATESCTVTLSYARATTATNGPFTTIPMTKVPGDTNTPIGKLATWRAVIPAADVTTTGLAYFMKAFDGYVTSFSPGTSYWGAYVPVDGVRTAAHPVRVLEPPHTLHAPIPTSYYNQPITIEARSNCATPVCVGTLHWRTSGHAWKQQVMAAAPPIPGAVIGDVWTFASAIPGSDATTEGVDYWIEVHDGYVADATPTYHVTVQAPTAVFHVPVLTADPATDVSIETVVACSTPNCTTTLSYRVPATGALDEPTWTELAMTPTEAGTAVGATTVVRRYGATIPAAAVTTKGVDYFIRSDDGHTTAYSPGSAYTGTQAAQVEGRRVRFFHIHVTEPIRYAHVPVVVAQAGDTIRIVTQANCSTGTCSGTLSYRATTGLTTVAGIRDYIAGLPAFTERAMSSRVVQDLGADGTLLELTADIPASAVTTAGVDYFFRLTDGTTQAFFPGTSYVGGAGSADGLRAAWQHVVVSGTHVTGSIGDHVFLDQSSDGVQQSNEEGLGGVRVDLTGAGFDNAFGTIDDSHASQTTDAEGEYVFGGLLPGTFRVDVDIATTPVGTTATTATSRTVNLGATATNFGVDFGFRFDGRIAGSMYVDANINRVRDAGESGVGGAWAVLTFAGADGVFGSGDDDQHPAGVTDAAGNYIFDGLRPGRYRVDLNPSTLPASGATTTARPVDIDLAPHQVVNGINFGIGFLPGAPTGVTATRGNGAASVSWTPPSSTGTGPITSYTVTATPGGASTVVSGSTTTASVAGLTNGTSYVFSVVAANGVGSGPTSAASAPVVPATVPTPPTGLTATPANASATVSWTAPVSNGGVAVTSYTVTASPGGATSTVGGSTLTTTVTGLINGTAYTFTVRATNEVGQSDPSAPSAAVTPATVPGAPTGVSAVRGNASATVSWTAPASNGGSAITSYTVTATPGGATASVGGSTLTATVTGLTNGTSYTFTVRAINAVGPGPLSAPSNAVVPSTVPSAPTGVSATAGAGSATVSWTAPSSNGGSAITGYTVTATPGGATASVGGSTLNATVTGLTNGTSYTFTVRATNVAGVGPASTPSNAVTPIAPPSAPATVTATGHDRSATVTWTAAASNGSPVTSYAVTASPGGAVVTVGGSTLSTTVTGLTNGTAYTFTVRATNAAGTGPASTPSNSVTPATTPGTPGNATATAGISSAEVSWTAPADNGGAAVLFYTVTVSPGGATKNVDAPATTTTMTGLTPGTSYTFTVKATNVVGTSAASAPSNSVVPYTVPGAPTGVSASARHQGATVSWTAPVSDGFRPITRYDVYANPGGHVAMVAAGATSATVGGLTNGTSYTFTVRATNLAGEGPASSPSNSVVPQPQAPGAPGPVTATAGTASALVKWIPGPANGSPVTSFTVAAAPGGRTVTASGSATSVAVDGLANGTAYTFTVTATNGVGTGPASNPSAAVTADAAGRPFGAMGLSNVASLNTDGSQGDAAASSPAVSADGRYVAFVSGTTNWLPNPQGYQQVWIRDLNTGVTSLVSANLAGQVGTGQSIEPALSADGRYVAFRSQAADLVTGDGNGLWDVFVRDRQTNATSRVSVGPGGAEANGNSAIPSLSSDGRKITFNSHASNLVTTDRNGNREDVFWRNLDTGTTLLVDANGFAGFLNGEFGYSPQASSARAGRQAVSGDGRYVVFTGHHWQGGLTSDRCSGTYDVPNAYIADLASGAPVVSRIGPASSLGCSDAPCCSNDTAANKPSVSRDGTIVAFIGMDRNLHLYGPTGIGPVVALLTPDGSAPNAPVFDPWLNVDGGRAAFSSIATNIVGGDNNGREDVFYIDFWGKGSGLVSATAAGSVPQTFSSAGGSGGPVLSDNGTKGAFGSTASDLAANDLNGVSDVFLIALAQPAGGPFKLGELLGGGNAAMRCICILQELANVTHHPIDTSTGNFWHTFDDLAIPGRGPALHLTHTYNAMAAGVDGPLGFGWTHSYNLRLDLSAASNTVNQENGAQVTFLADGSGGWVPPPRADATLVKNVDDTWTFTRMAKEIFLFDATGRLTAIRDLNGYQTSLTYPNATTMVVTDPGGRTFTFTKTGTRVTSVVDSGGRSVSFAYNGAGNLTQMTDVGGGVTTFTYDGAHRMLTMLDPNQQGQPSPTPITNVFDSAGRVTSQADALGRTTLFDYTSIPGSTKVTDPKGNVEVFTYVDGRLVVNTKGYGTANQATSSFTYDPVTSMPTTVTDANGHRTTLTYDAKGNVLTSTDALGRTTTTTYNALSNPLTVKDPKNVTTTMTYDGAGNPLTRSTPLVGTGQNQVTTFTYSATRPGDLETSTDPNGKVWSATYDAVGNQVTATDPLGKVSESCYDALGRQTAVISRNAPVVVDCQSAAPAAFTTYFTYNAYGDVLTTKDPLGHQSVNTYDKNRNLKTAKDPLNNTTTYTYDKAGQLTSVARPGGTTLGYSYDALGNRTGYTDGAGRSTAWAYADPGLPNAVTSSTDPNNRTTASTYDRAGNRTALTDPALQVTTFAYDVADQLTSISYDDPATPDVTAIGYDPDGQRLSMTDGTGTSTWVWDSLHRMTSSTNGAGQTVGYGYDLRGSLTTLAYPGGIGTVTRTYDDAGRWVTVKDWANRTTTFGYDADGNLTTQTYPNGTTATQSFDGGNRLTGISHAPTATPGSPFASFTYTRDNADQLASVTSTGVPADNHTYTYTPLNQLKNVDAAAYGYDTADNLVTLVDGSKQAFDPANQLCWAAPSGTGTCAAPPAGATTYTYDNRGNRTVTDPPGSAATTLAYDQANRLTAYGTTATYSYNGDGLRTSKTVSGASTGFAWDVASELPMLLLEGPTAYVYGPGGLPLEQVSGATVRYYHHDQLGSTRAITSSAGAVLATYTFDPYGKPAGSTGSVVNPFGYAGQYTDSESGFQYLRARYYDPGAGQFLTRDPIVAWTLSAYGYARGGPLHMTDPAGLGFLKSLARGLVVGAAVVGATALVLGTAGVAAPVVAGAAISWAAIGTGAAVVGTIAGAVNSYYSCRDDGPTACASAVIGTVMSAIGAGLGGAALKLGAAGVSEGAQAVAEACRVYGAGFGGASDAVTIATSVAAAAGAAGASRDGSPPVPRPSGPGYTGSERYVDWDNGGIPYAR